MADKTSDRELLEMAAEAAGIETHGWRATEPYGGYYVLPEKETGAYTLWNPLNDDGDALRLAVKLRLEIGFPTEKAVWAFGRTGRVCREINGPDPYASTRRAIVRATAEIGKEMP